MAHHLSEIDWPLTVTLVAAVVAAIFAPIAVWYGHKGWLGSPASEPITPEELFVLDEIERANGLVEQANYEPTGGGGRACGRIGGARRRLVSWDNTVFWQAVRELDRKALIEGDRYFWTVSEKGRAVLRVNRRKRRTAVPMLPPDDAEPTEPV